ncbi:MAG TPA: oxalate/formate MFS antiporter, partial [Myxococcaceae bacterium]|nr:oxalate/formate MFS antiporter [Myxococcaceae bacterium]
MAEPSAAPAVHPPRVRWVQLFLGVLSMVMIANLQYGWTLFVGPIDQMFHWGRKDIQVAFTLFVLAETWPVPFEGYLIDRFGPRVVVLVGGGLVGLAWVMNSMVTSLAGLYTAAIIGGLGAGAVYGTAVGNSLKWFTDRRGLAAGLTGAGFGMGAAATVIPIANTIQNSGFQAAFLRFGIFQGVMVMLCALFLRAPRSGEVPPITVTPKNRQTARDYTWREAVRTPTFWVMYLMFVMVAAGGLMATAQLAPIAKDYKVAGVPVSLLGVTLPALTFALTIDRILNGLTRPFFGWVSDHLGRENTMFAAFMLEGAGILFL